MQQTLFLLAVPVGFIAWLTLVIKRPTAVTLNTGLALFLAFALGICAAMGGYSLLGLVLTIFGVLAFPIIAAGAADWSLEKNN